MQVKRLQGERAQAFLERDQAPAQKVVERLAIVVEIDEDEAQPDLGPHLAEPHRPGRDVAMVVSFVARDRDAVAAAVIDPLMERADPAARVAARSAQHQGAAV